MKIRHVLLTVLLCPPCLAAQSSFQQVVDRAQLGTFDLDVRGGLGEFQPPERDLIRALYALARRELATARASLQRYAARRDGDITRQREFYLLTEELALDGARYGEAARAGAALETLPGAAQQPDHASDLQTLGIAQRLKGVPPVRVVGGVVSGPIPASKDSVGLTRVGITIEGRPQQAVVDTGASFSVVSATTARALGLTPLTGSVTLGSSVSAEISSKIAIAKHLQVGETRFESVVLLVLDDEQLSFPVPGGYTIPAILGFPELQRLGRLRFDDHAMRVGGEPATVRRNLLQVDGKLYVQTDVDGSCVPLHLDTGASASELTRPYAEAHPRQIATLQHRERQLGGAGGVSRDEVLNWEGARFAVGDRQVTLPQLDVSQAKEMSSPVRYGTLGRDVLARGYGIDFEHMQLWIEGDQATSPDACAGT